jgi:putative membrane protein
VTDGTSRPAGRVHRLHGSTLVFDVGRRFASFAFVGLAAVFFAARRAELWYLAFLLPPVVQALLRYVSFRYTFTPEHLVIREGVFVRSVRHVPYTRVQNIDTLQGPLHRLLDVVEVRLETAGGSEPEALFRVISSAQLGELRAHVFAARGHADEANADALDAPGAPGASGARPFFRMRTADVLLFGLLMQRGLVLAGGAIVALRELASWGDLEERLAPRIEVLTRDAEGLGPVAWIVLGVGLFLLLQLGSLAWALITLHGFRIERRGEDLRTSCGLFTRQSASLPRSRVQFLEVRSTALQRLGRRLSVRALSAGGDSTEASQMARKWLVPLAPRTALESILAEVQPEADGFRVDWRPVHARAGRRLLWRWLLGLELLAGFAWLHSVAAGSVASALAAVLAWLCARQRARTLAWSLGRRAIFVRDGVLGRRLTCVRFEKIQSISLRRSPLDRRAGMAHLSVDTAAAHGELRLVVPFLGLRAASRLVRHLQREAAAVPFRW